MTRDIDQIKAREFDLRDSWPRYGNEEDILTLLGEIRRLEGHLGFVKEALDNAAAFGDDDPNGAELRDMISVWEKGR